MMTLSTAKILFFIAMTVGPKDAHTILATSNSDTCVWSATDTGWTVDTLGFPASDFTRNPGHDFSVGKTLDTKDVPENLKAISKHNWNHDTVMIFDNGDRIEKDGDHAFYIINAGGANEKVFTILFPKED